MIGFPASIARIQSGTIRFSDQSPPPITFPALAEAINALSLTNNATPNFDNETDETMRKKTQKNHLIGKSILVTLVAICSIGTFATSKLEGLMKWIGLLVLIGGTAFVSFSNCFSAKNLFKKY